LQTAHSSSLAAISDTSDVAAVPGSPGQTSKNAQIATALSFLIRAIGAHLNNGPRN
jgi:hypothetical protein